MTCLFLSRTLDLLRLRDQIFFWTIFQHAASARTGGSWDWREAEASLYCIRAIAKAVPSSEDTFMPQVTYVLK